MERKCTACIHPGYTCETCPITTNYWTSLPSEFTIPTSGSFGITEDRIRAIIKEELEQEFSLKNKYIEVKEALEKWKKSKCEDMTFEEALTALKAGKWVTRSDWNGKNQYVCMLEGGQELDTLTFRGPFLVLFNAQGDYVPWVPSTGDLFSNKWKITR